MSNPEVHPDNKNKDGENTNPFSVKDEEKERQNLELVRIQVDGLTQIMAALQKNFVVMSQVVSGLEKKMNSIIESINITQNNLKLTIVDLLNQDKNGNNSIKKDQESNNQSK
jgi:hypothetical protein